MIRTHQLKGNQLVDRLKQLSKPINENVVSMVQPSKYHDRISPTSRILQTFGKQKPIGDEEEEEIDLDEILNELEREELNHWGYVDGNEIDDLSEDELKDYINYILTKREDDVELGDTTKEELKEFVRGVVRERFYEEVEDEQLFDEMIDEILMDEVSQFIELTEGTIKFDGIELRGGFSGGNSNTLVYRPISSKMMDKIEDMGVSEDKIIKKIISFLQNKHRGLKFQQDYSYEGYGYPIKLDMWSFN